MTGTKTTREDREWASPVCVQPECALRKIEFNRTRLAELLVEAISRDGERSLVSERERIVPRRVCSECALRVVRGQRAFLTADEKSRVIEEIESRQPDGFIVLD